MSQQSDDDRQHRTRIVVNGIESVFYDRDGNAAGVPVRDLEVGESREFTTDEGRVVRVERDEDAIRVRVDDKQVSVLSMATGGAHTDFVHRVTDNAGSDRSVMLLPGRNLDRSECEALEAALLATGLVDQVTILPDEGLSSAIRITR